MYLIVLALVPYLILAYYPPQSSFSPYSSSYPPSYASNSYYPQSQYYGSGYGMGGGGYGGRSWCYQNGPSYPMTGPPQNTNFYNPITYPSNPEYDQFGGYPPPPMPYAPPSYSSYSNYSRMPPYPSNYPPPYQSNYHRSSLFNSPFGWLSSLMGLTVAPQDLPFVDYPPPSAGGYPPPGLNYRGMGGGGYPPSMFPHYHNYDYGFRNPLSPHSATSSASSYPPLTSSWSPYNPTNPPYKYGSGTGTTTYYSRYGRANTDLGGMIRNGIYRVKSAIGDGIRQVGNIIADGHAST